MRGTLAPGHELGHARGHLPANGGRDLVALDDLSRHRESMPPRRAKFRRMATHAVGIDMIEIERVERVLRRHPERFIRRVFTPAEAAFCRGRVPELAARFAAKEAVMKALGTGARSVAWQDIEVLPDRRGKPLVYLYRGGLRRAEEIGLGAIDISLTHLDSFAVAAVVCWQERPEQAPEDARPRLIARLRARGLLAGEGPDEQFPAALPPIQERLRTRG